MLPGFYTRSGAGASVFQGSLFRIEDLGQSRFLKTLPESPIPLN